MSDRAPTTAAITDVLNELKAGTRIRFESDGVTHEGTVQGTDDRVRRVAPTHEWYVVKTDTTYNWSIPHTSITEVLANDDNER